MKDADIIIGSVDNGRANVLDENCTGNYGPHENDTLLGGTYDILESGGMETGGNTVIELKRKMNTGDKFDKAFVHGQQVPIIWAMADTTDNSAKHNMATGEGVMALEGGV
jgi:xylose isomerase